MIDRCSHTHKLNMCQINDLCDIGAVLYQLSY